MHNCDIIIVGGGAAGLFAAITAKRENPKLNISVIERNERVGKKLITTGNGRGNLSNLDLDNKHFHSSNTEFLSSALLGNSLSKTKAFYDSVGIETVAESDGRVFPASFQASSVVDALRFSLEEMGINLITDTKIEMIKPAKDGFLCSSETERFFCRSLILTTGGLAGGKKLGCDNSGYDIAKSLGHKTVKLTPAITQIKTDTSVIRRFKGIKTEALVAAYCGGKHLRSERGELLFCDYGISGPPVFQISGSVSGKNNCEIKINLLPDFSSDKLFSLLKVRRNTLKNRTASEFLTGFMNKRVGQYFVKLCAENALLCDDITDIQLQNMAKNITDFKLEVKSVADFANAQVTKGGIDCGDVYPDTLMSKKVKGLIFAGEVLDVDGDCGGYNLQWALHSAIIAARTAVEYLK